MSEPTPTPAAAQGQQIQLQIREEKAHTVYSNMAAIRGTHTAEEIIIDLGITAPNPERQDAMVMDVNTRVVMNYFSAKRLALQLSQIVQRYEQQFGPLELDPRRRVKQG